MTSHSYEIETASHFQEYSGLATADDVAIAFLEPDAGHRVYLVIKGQEPEPFSAPCWWEIVSRDGDSFTGRLMGLGVGNPLNGIWLVGYELEFEARHIIQTGTVETVNGDKAETLHTELFESAKKLYLNVAGQAAPTGEGMLAIAGPFLQMVLLGTSEIVDEYNGTTAYTDLRLKLPPKEVIAMDFVQAIQAMPLSTQCDGTINEKELRARCWLDKGAEMMRDTPEDGNA